jgi:hypothetical protein
MPTLLYISLCAALCAAFKTPFLARFKPRCSTFRANFGIYPPPRKSLKINALNIFPTIYFVADFVGAKNISPALRAHPNFCLDARKFPSIQKFCCVVTEKYFRLDGNFALSLPCLNQDLQDFRIIRIKSCKSFNPANPDSDNIFINNFKKGGLL